MIVDYIILTYILLFLLENTPLLVFFLYIFNISFVFWVFNLISGNIFREANINVAYPKENWHLLLNCASCIPRDVISSGNYFILWRKNLEYFLGPLLNTSCSLYLLYTHITKLYTYSHLTNWRSSFRRKRKLLLKLRSEVVCGGACL